MKNILCGIFGHKFNEWEYLDANTRVQVCQRCNHKHTQVKEICSKCNGKGEISFRRKEEYKSSCGQCGGSGEVEHYTQGLAECNVCDGTGVVTLYRRVTDYATCSNCKGLKYIWSSDN